MTEPRPRLAILGAGPVGLDAALAAAERGWSFTLYEAGERPAACVRDWGHVRLFSPWSIDASRRMRSALAGVGHDVPDSDDCPTGHELCDRLLDPLAELPAIRSALRLGHRVEAVSREGLLKHEEIGGAAREERPFRLLVRGPDGSERIEHADAVLDCTGTYTHPNSLGDAGIPAPGETGLGDRIARRIPDFGSLPEAWAGQTILLVGGGHSAQTAARDLAQLGAALGARLGGDRGDGTRVIWALRSTEPSWVIDDDPLPARAELAREAETLARGEHPAVEPRLGVAVEALETQGDRVIVTLRTADGGREEIAVDRVLALTGSVGDDRLYRQLQVHECYATGAPMKLSAALLGAGGGGGDCMAQTGFGPETLTNPEPRFFILGAKSYGRNSAFLMRIGWEQVDDVFGLLGGG
jgi:thioredoxin reductase